MNCKHIQRLILLAQSGELAFDTVNRPVLRIKKIVPRIPSYPRGNTAFGVLAFIVLN